MPQGIYKRKKKKAAKVAEVKVIEDVSLNSLDYAKTIVGLNIVDDNIESYILTSPVFASPHHALEKVKVETARKLLTEVFEAIGVYL